MPTDKFHEMLDKHNITRKGWATTEFMIMGYMKNIIVHNFRTPELPGEREVVFSEAGRKWVKKLIVLLNTDKPDPWIEYYN
ncbi:hypothetical protein [Emticicia sp. SJ17W-69]|uniref:hypothetical protein n=1 Tax=Emticicia sp. SJ17W-69 TaxID=3421657 RepID=UPI003EBFF8F1